MNAETKKRVRLFVRKHRGAQGELAAMLGVSESFLSQYLRGRSVSARLDREIPGHIEALKQRVIERSMAAVVVTA